MRWRATSYSTTSGSRLRRWPSCGAYCGPTVGSHSPSGPRPRTGQALLGRAVEAAGLTRPAHLPPVSAEFDFPRTADGLAALLTAAGLREAATDVLHWTHRATPQGWWDGAAGGVGFIGQLLLAQREQTRAEVRRHFDRISQEFTDSEGLLSLPHTALLVHAHR